MTTTREEQLEQLLEQLGKAGEIHGEVVVDDVRRILATVRRRAYVASFERDDELVVSMSELDAIILDELLGEP